MNEKNDPNKKIIGISIVITLMISMTAIGILGSLNNNDSEYSIEELAVMSYDLPNGELVRCLNNHNATVYISKFCDHCHEQATVFGDSFWGLDYVDCGLEGSNCSGITGVPSWTTINGSVHPGVHSLEELSVLYNCTL